jgi:hypothetical protein
MRTSLICLILLFLGLGLGARKGSDRSSDVQLKYVKSGGFADIEQVLEIERTGGGDGLASLVSDIPAAQVETTYSQKQVERLILYFQHKDFCSLASNYMPESYGYNEYVYTISFRLANGELCEAKWVTSAKIPYGLSQIETYLERIKSSLM